MSTPIQEEPHKPPVLDLGEVHLRPLRSSDTAALLGYLSDTRVLEHTSIAIPTPASVAAAVERDIAAYDQRTSFRLALANANDRLIGICGFNSWSPVHRHAELAYDLAPEQWGRGIMQKAVKALLGWGFSELRLNRVHAFVMTSNARSIRLLERCGFSREGTLRRYRIARGEPKDFHLYAILVQDFYRNESDASSAPSPQRTPRR